MSFKSKDSNPNPDPNPSSQVVSVPCKYKTGRTLGHGTYAVVKETGQYYAAKIMNKKLMKGRDYMVRNEINVLKHISQGHPNILTLVDCFETVNNLYLIMELASGGELFDQICEKGSYYESDAAILIRTTVDAVAYLHDNGVVHRDLKPENLLFKVAGDYSSLLIADFGLSRIIDTEKFSMFNTQCGTPGYMAPEVFLRSGHGKPVDMWAIGVTTYYLLCGYPPFDQDDETLGVQAILNVEYSFTPEQYWEDVSETEPDTRATANQALEHPWLKQVQSSSSAPTSPTDSVSSSSTVTPKLTPMTTTTVPKPSIKKDNNEIKKTGIAAKPAKNNLFPNIRENFNARRTFRKAVGVVQLVNHLKKFRALPVDEDLVDNQTMQLTNNK